MTFACVIETSIGKIGLTLSHDKLTKLSFLADDTPLQAPEDLSAKLASDELQRYFANSMHPFNLELEPQGTAFQQSVWQALRAIPSGEVLTYGALAKRLQTSPLALGQACRTNPLPIFIPCHRIVAAQHVGGYTGKRDGKALDIKKWLLCHEGVV